MIITYLITTLPDIHELTFGYTPRLLCLYLGNVVHVVKNEAPVELSHEREVMDKGQVKPHVGVAESTRDLLKHYESDVLMKEIVHGIWVTAQNVWHPLNMEQRNEYHEVLQHGQGVQNRYEHHDMLEHEMCAPHARCARNTRGDTRCVLHAQVVQENLVR